MPETKESLKRVVENVVAPLSLPRVVMVSPGLKRATAYTSRRCTQDADGAIRCARKALEQDLEPMIPPELTNEAHATRVREIFEPFMRR